MIKRALAFLLTLALVLALGGGALWLFLRCDLGARPAAKSYGPYLSGIPDLCGRPSDR